MQLLIEQEQIFPEINLHSHNNDILNICLIHVVKLIDISNFEKYI